MPIEPTDEENRVIEILVRAGRTENAFGGPIHAVDRAMGWTTAQTMQFVEHLQKNNFIVRKITALNLMEEGGQDPKYKSWWERPSEGEII